MAPMQALSSTANIATRLVSVPQKKQVQRRSAVSFQALFTKKKPVVVEEEKPAPKRSFFGGNKKTSAPAPVVESTPGKTGFTLFGSKKTAVPAPVVETPSKTGFTLFGSSKKAVTKTATKTTTTKVDKAAEYKKQESILSAFDFSTARSKSDAELLYDARYGKLENGKMSKEQYAALRRKIGGTSKDFFKGWVDVKGEYTDKGYVAKEENPSAVPALPFLVGVVLALFGTLGYVVSQTSQ
ncbi:hypothetical protein Ndes2437B_g03833 [Nannochloris sp. 'desiccata']|nr:hypothetical protein KSW81_003356 [Chlorella desiccata (nom. nud.)]